jgi:hypothetical protein
VPNFEIFRRGAAPIGKQPYVTLNKRGVFLINKAAYQAIGQPQAVIMMFDPSEKIVGMQPVEAGTADAYAVHTTTRDRSFLVSGKAFCNYYELPLGTSIRYPASVNDGILCINIAEGGTEVSSNRSGSGQAGQAEDEVDPDDDGFEDVG